LSVPRARALGVLVAGCALGAAALVTPATADTTPGYDCVVDTPNASEPATVQPLQVCASFDKVGYESGDTVKLTVSVTNLGDATAPNVYLPFLGIAGSSFRSFGSGLDQNGLVRDGIDLPAGATVIVETDGYAAEPASGVVQYGSQIDEGTFVRNGSTGRYSFGPDVDITSTVTSVTNGYNGQVLTDAGDALAGVSFTLTGPFDGINGLAGQEYSATTDGQGEFQFTGLPAGQYTVAVNAPAGWVVPTSPTPQGGDVVTVDGSPANTNVAYSARRPLSETLHAAIAFDKKNYQVGDIANLTVTLTNTGSTDLHGIQADCNHYGSSEDISGTGAGWDALSSAGVDVPAGEVTTLHLAELIPTRQANGTIYAECMFGPDVRYFVSTSDFPDPTATATVTEATGPTANFTMDFAVDNPLANSGLFRTTLLDPVSHDPAAVVGWDGSISGLPTGTYDIGIGDTASFAPGQASTIDTADLTDGQAVTVHVLNSGPQPAPPAPPTG
jgi:hypothetical protein